jgi:hypothetical protein
MEIIMSKQFLNILAYSVSLLFCGSSSALSNHPSNSEKITNNHADSFTSNFSYQTTKTDQRIAQGIKNEQNLRGGYLGTLVCGEDKFKVSAQVRQIPRDANNVNIVVDMRPYPSDEPPSEKNTVIWKGAFDPVNLNMTLALQGRPIALGPMVIIGHFDPDLLHFTTDQGMPCSLSLHSANTPIIAFPEPSPAKPSPNPAQSPSSNPIQSPSPNPTTKPSNPNPEQAQENWYSGGWQGQITQTQPGASVYNAVFSLKTAKVGEVFGTSNYVEINCGGELTLLSMTDKSLEFQERLIYGIGRCRSGVKKMLTLIAPTSLSYAISSGQNAIATATLKRADNSELKRYAGRWRGRISQGGSSGYTGIFVFNPGNVGDRFGESEYTELGCGGDLILLSVSAKALEFQENITYGGGCISGIRKTVTFTSPNELKYSLSPNQGYSSSAILTRNRSPRP